MNNLILSMKTIRNYDNSKMKFTYIIRLLDVIVYGKLMVLCKTIFHLKKSLRPKHLRVNNNFTIS